MCPLPITHPFMHTKSGEPTLSSGQLRAAPGEQSLYGWIVYYTVQHTNTHAAVTGAISGEETWDVFRRLVRGCD